MALRECLEAHADNENLLYLTDSEATLQAINKWIGEGAKLSLEKTVDADIHPSREGTDETRAGEDMEHVNQQDYLPMVGDLHN